MITWAIGTRLDPYMLVSPIGAGGMGEVWKARDTRLDRVVAIKRLKGEYTSRFKREARAIAALNHPNICQLYDIGPDYLVMEYIDGKPLRCPLTAEEAVRLAIQIASALEQAHRKGIIHSDLKPSNIMVTEAGAAKLLDFGLATLMTTPDSAITVDTIDDAVTGTPAYLAPEQAQGRALDSRCDVFSFGAVLYEMLSGRRAFEGDSLAQILSAVLRDDPLPLEGPWSLDVIVRRCLAKDPAQRFQTMSEVKAALEQFSQKPAGVVPSIAVLPFTNLSADKENEYFSDGLAEELINMLARVPGLKVTARTSSFAFRGKDQDIRKIGGTLDVRSILEGSVRRSGSRIRVTVQLINAEDGYHLWSERYDRQMADVFAMQDEIAQAIAAALEVKLSIGPRPLARYTPNIPAYEAFLKGVYHGARLTPESFALSRKYLEEAIALDPKFALAHNAIGGHLFVLACGTLLSAHEAMPAARRAAQAALDIDPSLPEAQAALGVIAAVYDYNWQEADRRFRLAMARDPIPPHVRHMHGFWYLNAVGRGQEAAAECEQALKKDPLSVAGHTNLGYCLLAAGTNAEACTEFHKSLEIDANFWFAFYGLGIAHALQGALIEALPFAEKAHSLAPWFPDTIGLLAGVLMRMGDTQRTEHLLEKLEPADKYGVPRGLAMFHALCGESDKAANWTEKAIEQRDPWVPLFMNSLLRKVLSPTPRWSAIARQINLQEL
jgi:serine/threonine protein kinase/Tfp pilus assembly protein PilF